MKLFMVYASQQIILQCSITIHYINIKAFPMITSLQSDDINCGMFV